MPQPNPRQKAAQNTAGTEHPSTAPAMPAAPRAADVRRASATTPGTGYLVVHVHAAHGAIPIADALVTVFAIQKNGSPDLTHTAYTNQSGKTRKFALPAPPRSQSLTPNGKKPYALYGVLVDHKSFHSVESSNLTIFDDVVARLTLSMQPLSSIAPPPQHPIQNPMPPHPLYQKE